MVKNASLVFVLGQEDIEVEVVADRLVLGDAARAFLRTCRPRPDSAEDAMSRRGLLRVGRRMVTVSIEASPEDRLFTTKPADLRAMRAEGVLAWTR